THMTIYTSLLSTHPPTTVTSTLSLHDALPISSPIVVMEALVIAEATTAHSSWIVWRGGVWRGDHIVNSSAALRSGIRCHLQYGPDRKSTRLNSSHVKISYAVFCLKKKRTSTSD